MNIAKSKPATAEARTKPVQMPSARSVFFHDIAFFLMAKKATTTAHTIAMTAKIHDIIVYFLNNVNPNHTFKQKLEKLLEIPHFASPQFTLFAHRATLFLQHRLPLQHFPVIFALPRKQIVFHRVQWSLCFRQFYLLYSVFS